MTNTVQLQAVHRVRAAGQLANPGQLFYAPVALAEHLVRIGSARVPLASDAPGDTLPGTGDVPGDNTIPTDGTLAGISLSVVDPAEQRARLIKDAVEALDPANNDHWTKAGRPSVAAVEDQLEFDIVAAELDGYARPDIG